MWILNYTFYLDGHWFGSGQKHFLTEAEIFAWVKKINDEGIYECVIEGDIYDIRGQISTFPREH